VELGLRLAARAGQPQLDAVAAVLEPDPVAVLPGLVVHAPALRRGGRDDLDPAAHAPRHDDAAVGGEHLGRRDRLRGRRRRRGRGARGRARCDQPGVDLGRVEHPLAGTHQAGADRVHRHQAHHGGDDDGAQPGEGAGEGAGGRGHRPSMPAAALRDG
jgi:hypothetical protein